MKETWRLEVILAINLNSSCAKVFGTHTFYKERGRGVEPTPMISKTVESATFCLGRPLGLSMRRTKKRVDDLSLVMFPWQLIHVRCFRPNFAKKTAENDQKF